METPVLIVLIITLAVVVLAAMVLITVGIVSRNMKNTVGDLNATRRKSLDHLGTQRPSGKGDEK